MAQASEMKRITVVLALLAVPIVCASQRVPSEASWPGSRPAGSSEPPALPRELRGVWIATVGNMDWPSRPGLPVAEQKAELIHILETAQQLRLNTVIFQVRPSGDALYASALEPWSEYITGVMGRAPEPFYDPLEFAIAEAHRRGLELHAWFNPFRARYSGARGTAAPTHFSRTHPEFVKPYGPFLWLDPSQAAVQDHTLAVIRDVVRRYDIDGVHLDDYFYPYQQHTARGRLIPFPDGASWSRYRASGGTLARDDWRRHNVDTFVERLYAQVKAIKPAVKVGISPFGIWRPGYPASVVGLDAYSEIFADARKWLRMGWADYFVPQLYWRIDAQQQSYPELLRWWVEQNEKGRQIWAGNAGFRVQADAQNWPAHEIVEQIRLTREQPGATGNVLFNMTALLRNHGGLTDSLAVQSYAFDALVPAMNWLDSPTPAPPFARIERHRLLGALLTLDPALDEPAFRWAIRLRFGDDWLTELIPAGTRLYLLARGKPALPPDEVAVSAVGRTGKESAILRITVGR